MHPRRPTNPQESGGQSPSVRAPSEAGEGHGRWTRVRRDAAEDAEVYNEASGYSMNKCLVLFERSASGYGAYAPDLPGCVATGHTLEETRERMAKAMEMHLSAMREDGDPIPEPSHFELVEAV